VPSSRPELTGLTLGGTPEPWEQFGFTLTDGEIHVGGVRLSFDGGEPGIRGWTLNNDKGSDLALPHQNGVTGIDHVVALTNDLDQAVLAFTERGFDHRRTREDAERRQAFFVLGPCLLELVGNVPDAGGFALWGITFVTNDVEASTNALAACGNERSDPFKDAVQPGRRIATVPREAGLGFPVALITPR
jgi:hypothetical protein